MLGLTKEKEMNIATQRLMQERKNWRTEKLKIYSNGNAEYLERKDRHGKVASTNFIWNLVKITPTNLLSANSIPSYFTQIYIPAEPYVSPF